MKSEEDYNRQAEFALVFKWSDRQGRAKFQDPSIQDYAVPQGAPDVLGVFGRQCGKPLKMLVDQGASISSRDYHEVGTATGRDMAQLITRHSNDLLDVNVW